MVLKTRQKLSGLQINARYLCKRDIYTLLKFPHNPPSESFIAFPTEFSQYNFSFALFRCFFFSPVLYLFERLEQEGSVTARVTYTSSPIAFKGATL